MSALRPRRSWPVDKVPEGEEAPGQAGGGGPLTSPTPSCDRAQNTAERPSGWTRPGTTCPPHSCARWRTAPRPCTPTGARCRPRCASRSFRGLPMSTPSNLAAPPALALIVCGAGTTPRPRTRRSRPTGARKAPSSPPRQPPDARPNARVPSRLASTSGPLECQIPEAVGAKAAPQLRLRVVSRANDTVIPGSPNGTSIPLLHNNLTIAFNGTAWEPHACPCTSACSGECAPAPQQFPHPTECPTYVLMSACHTCAPFPHKLYACMCVCVCLAQALCTRIVRRSVQRDQSCLSAALQGRIVERVPVSRPRWHLLCAGGLRASDAQSFPFPSPPSSLRVAEPTASSFPLRDRRA